MSNTTAVTACWCGETRPYYADDLDATCAGTGVLNCSCGGDFCACHWHGEVECSGCTDCEYDDDWEEGVGDE